MTQKALTDIKTMPFRGGCKTAVEPELLSLGDFSMIQNMRQLHPGMEARKGQIALHSTPDGTNRVMNLYQFVKGKVTERHLYAQMSDSDILEATNAPPTVTTGVFGAEVFSGSASPIPASFANNNDMLLMCNGVDLPQIYPGIGSKIQKFIIFRGAAAPTTYPSIGEDWTLNVTGFATAAAPLDSLGDLSADYDCVFVCCPVVANTLTWTVSLPNGTAAVMLGKYRKSDGTWAALASFTDNTAVGGKTLAQSGTMTWTAPTDSIPSYMYGATGFWYQFYLDTGGDLDSEVEVTAITYEAAWQSIVNMCDGAMVPIIEAQFFNDTYDTWHTYGSASITLAGYDGTAFKKNGGTIDALYISSFDDIEAIYVEIVGAGNTTASVALAVYRWNGAAWVDTSCSDGTNGCTNSGWITFARGASKPQQFNNGQYYAHWYKITPAGEGDYITNSTPSPDEAIVISVRVLPYYDINEIGKGMTCASWKQRAVYGTNIDQYLYLTPPSSPMVLNGDDFTMLEPGDGRSNRPVCLRNFKDDLMVFQEEKGKDGGCITKFTWHTDVDDISKLNVSTTLGAMNAKCVDVVDGIEAPLNRDQPIMTLAFFLSRRGIFITDGSTFYQIDDDIRNYFDPTKTECIRRGYEDKMWLKYDSAKNVIRIGLVSGQDSTLPNVFPVLDLKDKAWSFDLLAQELNCMTEVEAASGNIPVLQVGGGVDDGTVYLMNTGSLDVGSAIDSFATMEIDGKGEVIRMGEFVLRLKDATGYAGAVVTPYEDGVPTSSITVDL
jgi:hypothetical protein